MVKVNTLDDFMDKVVGTGDTMSLAVDIKPEEQEGVVGSFVILFKGFLHESMGNRLKKVMIRYGNTNPDSKSVYLRVGEDDSPLILLGSVDFSMKFLKDVESVFSSQSSVTRYKLYHQEEMIDFNPDSLISTIKFIHEPAQSKFV